jgi:hypothetical protein
MADNPVEFSIQGVSYKVPRNFIIGMDNWNGGQQQLVYFRVTFPGLLPRTSHTSPCLDGPVSLTGLECSRQDFFLTTGYPASDSEAFANASSLFISKTPRRDAYGFEEFDTGPPTARTVTFLKRMIGHWLVFQCKHIGGADDRGAAARDVAPCTRHAKLTSGNELIYHFSEGKVPLIESFDSQLIDLVRSFQVSKE